MRGTVGLAAEPELPFPVRGSWWRHKKSEANYHVVCCARVEATLEWVVVYADASRVTWTRPLEEFMDGRFEHLSD